MVFDMPSCSSFLSLFVSLSLVARALPQILQAPYTIPSYVTLQDSSWPTPSTWAALNSTLGGRLRALRPWAAVCYTNDPLYDLAKCKTVLSSYTNDHTVSLIQLTLNSFDDPLVSVKAFLQHFFGQTGRAAVTVTGVH